MKEGVVIKNDKYEYVYIIETKIQCLYSWMN